MRGWTGLVWLLKTPVWLFSGIFKKKKFETLKKKSAARVGKEMAQFKIWLVPNGKGPYPKLDSHTVPPKPGIEWIAIRENWEN